MLPTSALADMFPVVVTPSHDGKYFHNYTLSLLNLVSSAAQQGLPLQVLLQRGESLITRARNNAVADFLAHPQWTHLFWIDSDIGFSTQAAYRLLLSDYDVACGVYPLKHENCRKKACRKAPPKRNSKPDITATRSIPVRRRMMAKCTCISVQTAFSKWMKRPPALC